MLVDTSVFTEPVLFGAANRHLLRSRRAPQLLLGDRRGSRCVAPGSICRVLCGGAAGAAGAAAALAHRGVVGSSTGTTSVWWRFVSRCFFGASSLHMTCAATLLSDRLPPTPFDLAVTQSCCRRLRLFYASSLTSLCCVCIGGDGGSYGWSDGDSGFGEQTDELST